MCKFLLAALPSDTDLAELQAEIPERICLSLLRIGTREPSFGIEHFRFTPIANPVLQQQLPAPGRIVRLTNLPCDCWSTLGTNHVADKEATGWRKIFDNMLSHLEHFGLIVHFGPGEDAFILRGPTPLVLSQDSLNCVQMDTYYEVTR